MISAVDQKISSISNNGKTDKRKKSLKLKDEIITGELKMLHNEFVIDFIDKVSGNADFVSQMQNAQVLFNELGLNIVDNITLTYTKATKPVDKSLSENRSFLKNKFNLEVT